ncbi:MAG: hypothetical protein NTV44_04845, partial [Firmicutes bacterium]|nr:hypothetical protein [Bacillota bacterium]
ENAVTQSAYYNVKVTNNAANIGTTTGTEYVSATAATGSITDWAGVGTGTAYADGSVKLDDAGDYLFNASIWAADLSTNISSISLTVKIKQNGGTNNTTPNVMTVFAINGSASTEIASVSQTAGFNTTAADETFFISGISASATITGIKLVYTTKSLGNLGVYYVKATPTYVSAASYVEQATAFANYVMDGVGSGASGSCSSVFTELQSEYNYMASASKTEFNANSDELFVNARLRYNYLANFLGRPSDTIGALVSSEDSTNGGSSLGLILLVAVVGLTSVLIYSFSSKKQDKYDA